MKGIFIYDIFPPENHQQSDLIAVSENDIRHTSNLCQCMGRMMMKHGFVSGVSPISSANPYRQALEMYSIELDAGNYGWNPYIYIYILGGSTNRIKEALFPACLGNYI